MSLLTIIQDVVSELSNVGTPPTFISGNTDSTVVQMVSLLNKEGQHLAANYPWQVMTKSVERAAVASTSGSAATDQGAIETICPGYLYILDDTIWLANQPFKLLGPLSPQQRTSLEAYKVQGAAWYYWIEGGHLWTSRPTYTSQTLKLRYQSRYWVLDADGVTYKEKFENDNDTTLLPERVLTLGLIWRWLSRNGLPYEQEALDYTHALEQYTSREGTRTILSATEQADDARSNRAIIAGVMNVTGSGS